MGEIRLNGKPRRVRAGETVAALLADLELDPRWVVAELNGSPVPRETFLRVTLRAGDQLELVRPVAGG